MKRLSTLLIVAALTLSVASSLFAGGIENKQNLSAEYIRTLNRNAATDSADAVVYNPAGVVKMEEGFYVNLSGQFATKEYSNTVNGTKYEDDEPNIIPSLFGLYRKDKWAAFGAFTIVNGGGKVVYENGTATTLALGQRIIAGSGGAFSLIKDQRLEGNSFYYGLTLGGAYAVNEFLSFALGVRYVDAQREREGFAVLSGVVPDRTFIVDYEETADGWGGIIGIDLFPTKDLNIALRYETKTSLELETKVNRDDMGLLQDGGKTRRDMPALLAFGIGWRFRPDMRIDFNFTQYQNASAKWEDSVLSLGDESKKTNGYELGIAFEYDFNEKLKGSLGWLYTETGIDPDNMSVEHPELDAVTLAGGIAYEARPGLEFNLGVMRSFYQDEVTSTGIELEKKVFIVALGVQYRFK